MVIIALLLLAASAVIAQDADRPLDPTATPDHGIVAGGVGFQPDPFRVERVAGGGDIDAFARNLGTDCVGSITVEPSFRFHALTSFPTLRFLFISDAVTWDASLIIRDPQGKFHCNNDSYGLHNPTVEIDSAAAGDYNVWVGSLSDAITGDLYVTTRTDVTPGSTGVNIPPSPTPSPTSAPTATPIPASALNPTLYPIFGTENLTAGFLPDPYFRVLNAGGALNVPDSAQSSDCVGFATAPPSFRVNWTGVSTRLEFLFKPVNAQQDAALIVQDPSGAWNCNSDFAYSYNEPQVNFINPAQGTYNVWVSDETAPSDLILGQLYVTEKQWSPETIPSGLTEATTNPITGLTPGASAFSFDANAPDPAPLVGIVGGGAVDIGSQNKDCPGAYPAQPSFAFMLPQATPYLRVFFISDEPKADAALIVRMPDGSFYCNDDSFNSKQPTVDVIGNTSTGSVSVWVGAFKAGDSIPGTLYLTRGGANPLDPTRPAPVIVGQ